MSIAHEAEIQRLTIALRLLRRKLDAPGLPDTVNVDARYLLDIADDAAFQLAEPSPSGREIKRGRSGGAAAAHVAANMLAGNVIPFAPRPA